MSTQENQAPQEAAESRQPPATARTAFQIALARAIAEDPKVNYPERAFDRRQLIESLLLLRQRLTQSSDVQR